MTTPDVGLVCCALSQALLKMDCQGLVVRLIQDFVLLTTAVEVAQRWRELAEKLAKVSKQQMDAYEAPHRDKNGVVDNEVRLDQIMQSVGVGQVAFYDGLEYKCSSIGFGCLFSFGYIHK